MRVCCALSTKGSVCERASVFRKMSLVDARRSPSSSPSLTRFLPSLASHAAGPPTRSAGSRHLEGPSAQPLHSGKGCLALPSTSSRPSFSRSTTSTTSTRPALRAAPEHLQVCQEAVAADRVEQWWFSRASIPPLQGPSRRRRQRLVRRTAPAPARDDGSGSEGHAGLQPSLDRDSLARPPQRWGRSAADTFLQRCA